MLLDLIDRSIVEIKSEWTTFKITSIESSYPPQIPSPPTNLEVIDILWYVDLYASCSKQPKIRPFRHFKVALRVIPSDMLF